MKTAFSHNDIIQRNLDGKDGSNSCSSFSSFNSFNSFNSGSDRSDRSGKGGKDNGFSNICDGDNGRDGNIPVRASQRAHRQIQCRITCFFVFCLLATVLPILVGCGLSGNPTKANLESTKAALFAVPFGIGGTPQHDPRANQIGARWIRLSGNDGLVWGRDEPTAGNFAWETIENNIFGNADSGQLLVTIDPYCSWAGTGTTGAGAGAGRQIRFPDEPASYSNYIRAAAERFPQIACFQLSNRLVTEWAGSTQELALLVAMTSRAIMQANPRAYILLPGPATPSEIQTVLRPMLVDLDKLRATADEIIFHAADMQWSGEYQQGNPDPAAYKLISVSGNHYQLPQMLTTWQTALTDSGFPGVPIWITEMSDYTGSPLPRFPGQSFPEKSELQQAQQLFKRYVYALAHGVQKVFWTSLLETEGVNGPIGGYSDRTGLLHNPIHDGLSHPKLAFFTYQFMTSVLSNVSWSTAKFLETGKDGKYVLQLSRASRPVWVVWWDRPANAGTTIAFLIKGVSGKKAVLAPVIADAIDGSHIRVTYPAMFSNKELSILNQQIAFSLGENPAVVIVTE